MTEPYESPKVRQLGQDKGMLYVSMSAYALGRELGMQGATEEINRQLENPTTDSLPGVRTIARLRSIGDVGVRVDTGATSIGHARSRAFHDAHKSGAETWISVDDDVEATIDTLAWLCDAVAEIAPRIVIAPCWVRTSELELDRVNLDIPQVRVERELARGGKCIQVLGGGFGLVAMNRAAMDNLAIAYDPALRYKDSDGVERLALFMEFLRDGVWYTEDFAFFERARAWATIEALVTGVTSHGGRMLDLTRLQ